MTRDEHIIQLGARAKAALKELGDAIAAAAPDAEKEAIADRFNAISKEIEKMDAWGRLKAPTDRDAPPT